HVSWTDALCDRRVAPWRHGRPDTGETPPPAKSHGTTRRGALDAPYLLMNRGETDYVRMVWAEEDRAGWIHRACLLDDANCGHLPAPASEHAGLAGAATRWWSVRRHLTLTVLCRPPHVRTVYSAAT